MKSEATPKRNRSELETRSTWNRDAIAPPPTTSYQLQLLMGVSIRTLGRKHIIIINDNGDKTPTNGFLFFKTMLRNLGLGFSKIKKLLDATMILEIIIIGAFNTDLIHILRFRLQNNVVNCFPFTGVVVLGMWG